MKPEALHLLEKARHAIHGAEILLRESEAEIAAGRIYYAMFYTASALLAENGLGSRKHSGVHALLGEHFAKPGRIDPKFHRLLLDAFDRRLQADYGFEAAITDDEVAAMIQQAREFLAKPKPFFRFEPPHAPCAVKLNISMAISEELLEILVCPVCKGKVILKEDGSGLKCVQCKRVYPVRDDIPVMLVDQAKIEP
ncbi:MAG: HEPN domain-containing protein [Bryobacteraceae bacterium]